MTAEERWKIHCNQLIDFKNQNGHCFVPKRHSVKGLGKLVCTQRTNEKNDQLSECRKKLLNDISFEWDDRVSVVQRLQK